MDAKYLFYKVKIYVDVWKVIGTDETETYLKKIGRNKILYSELYNNDNEDNIIDLNTRYWNFETANEHYGE